MTQTSNLTPNFIHPPALRRRMLIGAATGLALIAVFLAGVQQPRPEWGSLWMVRPLMIVPLAGATGGACFYFIGRAFAGAGWNKGLAVIASAIIFIVGLWMGVVLGLAGTLWH